METTATIDNMNMPNSISLSEQHTLKKLLETVQQIIHWINPFINDLILNRDNISLIERNFSEVMDKSVSDDGKKSNSSSSDLCLSTTTIIGSSLIDKNHHNDSQSNAEEKNNEHILEAIQPKQYENSIEGKNSAFHPQLF